MRGRQKVGGGPGQVSAEEVVKKVCDPEAALLGNGKNLTYVMPCISEYSTPLLHTGTLVLILLCQSYDMRKCTRKKHMQCPERLMQVPVSTARLQIPGYAVLYCNIIGWSYDYYSIIVAYKRHHILECLMTSHDLPSQKLYRRPRTVEAIRYSLNVPVEVFQGQADHV